MSGRWPEFRTSPGEKTAVFLQNEEFPALFEESYKAVRQRFAPVFAWVGQRSTATALAYLLFLPGQDNTRPPLRWPACSFCLGRTTPGRRSAATPLAYLLFLLEQDNARPSLHRLPLAYLLFLLEQDNAWPSIHRHCVGLLALFAWAGQHPAATALACLLFLPGQDNARPSIRRHTVGLLALFA